MSRVKLWCSRFAAALFALLVCFPQAVLGQSATEDGSHGSSPTLLQDRSAASRSERVLFGSLRPANWDVYYFAGSGSEPRRLTDYPGLDYDPALSPDGRWVVFTSERAGNPDLFVIDLHQPTAPPRLLIDSDVMEDQATFSPDGRTLFFVSTRDGGANIFSLPFRPDQTQGLQDAINLMPHRTGAFRPSVSPDGHRIAFSSNRDHWPTQASSTRLHGGDVYVVDVDGGAPRRLTHTEGEGWSGSPTWSADGEIVYFYRREGDRREPRFGLWSVPASGGEPRLVFEDTLAILSPSVAPGGRVGFAVGRAFSTRPAAPPPRFAIWSVLPDGSELRLESDTLSSYAAPEFGPAGSFVAHGPGPVALEQPQTELGPLVGGAGPLLVPGAPWRRKLPDRELELYPVREFLAAALPSGDSMVRALPPGPWLVVSALDGSEPREVVDLGGSDFLMAAMNAVAASPDGEWLAYTSGPMFGWPEDHVDLWKVRMDGTGAVNLTPDSPSNDGFPSFSADGTWLAFRSGRTGDFDIFRMDADGSDVRNLTDHPARDIFPVVSPQGGLIAFLSDRDSPEPEVYEVYLLSLESDGSPGAVRRITNSGQHNGHPYFSPDGDWLVFTSGMNGINDEVPLVESFVFAPQMFGELYAYRIADGLLVRLTHDKWEDGFPSWAPATFEGAEGHGSE